MQLDSNRRDDSTMLLDILRSLPSFRPGVAYVLSDTLYLAPTARSPAARTMRSCRGPVFAAPKDGFAPLDAGRIAASASSEFAPLPESWASQQTMTAVKTGFEPLAPGTEEPTGLQLASLVEEYLLATAEAGGDGDPTAGEGDPMAAAEVVFQGEGDPMAAAEVVIDTVKEVARRREGIAFRLNTLGLCDSATTERLFESGVFAPDGVSSTRIASASVFLPAVEPQKYEELLQPSEGRGFEDVCSFISRVAQAGVPVEVTAVDRPDVDVAAIEALAMRLGATRFRTRSWIG